MATALKNMPPLLLSSSSVASLTIGFEALGGLKRASNLPVYILQSMDMDMDIC